MIRRTFILGLIALMPGAALAGRARYYRRIRKLEPKAGALERVRTIRIIPLPGRLAPTFEDHWRERVMPVMKTAP